MFRSFLPRTFPWSAMAALALAMPAVASAEESVVEAGNTYNLVGIMMSGGEPRFALRAPGLSRAEWVRLGETSGGCTVSDYWPDLEAITVRTTTGEKVLALRTGKVREAFSNEGGPGDMMAPAVPAPIDEREYAQRAAEAARDREIRRREHAA